MITVRTRAVSSNAAVEAIEDRLSELDSDRVTLERAKEILERR